MVIKTEPKASRLGANLIASHVEGQLENHVNWAEVDAVEAITNSAHLLHRLEPSIDTIAEMAITICGLRTILQIISPLKLYSISGHYSLAVLGLSLHRPEA